MVARKWTSFGAHEHMKGHMFIVAMASMVLIFSMTNIESARDSTFALLKSAGPKRKPVKGAKAAGTAGMAGWDGFNEVSPREVITYFDR